MVVRFTSSLFKSRIFWLVIVLVLVLAAGMIWYSTQMVGFVVAEPKVSYRCGAGKTVMNALVISNVVAFEQTERGPIVTAINDVAQGEGTRWSFTIDGVSAENSAMATICTGTEQIIWQLK